MGREIDLTGQTYGKLTVIEKYGKKNYNGHTQTTWLCKCECGNFTEATTNALRTGKKVSCGCRIYEKRPRGSKQDLVGKQFGLLTVLRQTDKRIQSCIAWKCQCTCGNICFASTTDLKTGQVKSCGCLIRQRNYHIGEKYGRLTILEKRPDKNGSHMVLCECDCGSIKEINLSNILAGKVVSCGCYQSEEAKKRFTEDLTGQRFGRLIAIEQSENIKESTAWKCLCDCGNYVNVRSCCLKNGETKSCGCLKSELSSERFSNRLEGQKFGKLTVIERRGTLITKDGAQYSQWYCECECGCHKLVKGADLISGKVKSCGCMISFGEYQVRSILESFGVKYSTQYTFSDLKSSLGGSLRFDFALYDNLDNMVCLIEYQGIQHYKEQKYFGEQQRAETDFLKREYCKENNIKLFEIKYDEDVEASLKNILQQVNLY